MLKMRLLQVTFVAIAAFSIIGLAPMVAQAVPSSSAVPFMGDNPSGKIKPDGSPLQSADRPSVFSAPKKADTFPAECPHEIKCVVVPAAYASNNNDPGNYGNYDKANRPNDMKINSIVIHDTEGSLQSVIQAFQNPTFYASSHYLVDTDGTIYQFVPTKDVAWHAGNWTTNEHSIGIEHVGYATQGSSGYTPAMYRSSAALVAWLSAKYDIPRDRQHIIGHDNVQAPNPALVTGMHVDPGPFWNWQNYMALIGASAFPQSKNNSWHGELVTVAPTWPLSKERVTGCWPTDKCVSSQLQPTNFVYLRAEPKSTAPLLADTVLGQGTTAINNASAKAFYGQTFAVQDVRVDRDGIWYKIWFSGTSGWFYSPWTAPAALPASGKYATPKPGHDSIPVYGRPLPEKSDYPADFTPPVGAITYPTPLPYTIKTGQRFAVMGAPVRADHFYAWTIDSSQDTYDHTVFQGREMYVPVQYNNRFGYVRLDDVVMK